MTSPYRHRYHPLGTGERHMLDQQLQAQRFAALEAERDRAFAHKYTFTPKLTPPRPLPTSTFAENEAVLAQGGTAEDALGDGTTDAAEETLQSAAARQSGSVFARLAAKAAEREARQRAREEAHRQQQALAQRGAFRPQVDPRSKALAERAMALDTLPVQDRLLQYGRNVALSHEAQRRQAREAEAVAFAAQKAPRRCGDEGVARYERTASKQAFEERNAALLEQRERRQAQAAVTDTGAFKPRISTTSALLDEQRRRRLQMEGAEEEANLDDAERGRERGRGRADDSRSHRSQSMCDPGVDRGAWLYQEAQRAQEQRERTRQALIEQEEREVFRRRTPQTNPVSDAWIARSEHNRLFACDFVTRQELYQRAQETERRLQQDAARETELSQSPGQTPAKVSPKAVEVQVTRLYDRARERSQQHRRRLADKVRADEDCTFAPQLSPGTKHVIRNMQSAREVDVVKRLTQSRARTADNERDEERGSATHSGASSPQSRGKEPTGTRESARHSPSSSPSSARAVVSPAAADIFYRRQMAQLSRKAYKVAMQRNEQATEELLHCTFRPKTNADEYYHQRTAEGSVSSRGRAASPSAATVSGVAAFLQRQAEAKRLREEKAERERNLGRGRPLSPDHRTTRFHPFKLTGDVRLKRLGAGPSTGKGQPDTDASAPATSRPFLSNLSTNSSTRALSLPPKRADSSTTTAARSRSALKVATRDDRGNRSVSFAESSDDPHGEEEAPGQQATPAPRENHEDPYDIQSLMVRLRQD